jgi:hypothetical protein
MREFFYWPESFEGYTHFSVQDWYVRNGQYGKFIAGLKTVHEALTAAEWGSYYGFFSIASGGHGNQIQLVTANRGWSDMADNDPSFSEILIEALGGEEAFGAFMNDWGSTFKFGDNRMVRLLPEASDYGDED